MPKLRQKTKRGERIDELEDSIRSANRERLLGYAKAVGGVILPIAYLGGITAVSYIISKDIETSITGDIVFAFGYSYFCLPDNAKAIKEGMDAIRNASKKIHDYREELQSLKGY